MNEDVHVVNLSSYTRPEVVESYREDWVEYGSDNQYYRYLIDRYIGSTTNHSIINGINNMIYGQGIQATDADEKLNQWIQFNSILSKQDIKKVIFDLKLLGEGSLQVIYKDGGKKVSRLKHVPRETLRAQKTADGEIKNYYAHPDWKEIKKNKPKLYPVFGKGKNETEILIIKRYVSGYDYYAPVDYPGGLVYAEMEEEISDYLINDIQNGFSGTKIVNFNNNIPNENKRRQIKDNVVRSLTGARGTKVIVSFNSNKDTETTVTDIPLNDAPEHYKYMSEECFKKLIVAHRVTSPMLLGMREGSDGLGNNADEIKTATQLFNSVVIKPYQQLILDAIAPVLLKNKINLDLYFKTLMPIDFVDTENIDNNKGEKEKETGIKEDLSSIREDFVNKLEGEYLDESVWELYDESEVGSHEDEKSALDRIEGMNIGLKQTLSVEEKSAWGDTGLYKLRYKYDGEDSGNSRVFCTQMLKRNEDNKYGMLYRKEDIDKLSSEAPNAGFGLKGAAEYDLFLWKGGPNCKHLWKRMIFFRKRKNGKFLPKSKTKELENDLRVANNPFVPQKGQEGQRNSDRPDKGYAE